VRRRTLAGPSPQINGAGVHTGATTSLRFVPAPPDTGIVFQRLDLDGAPPIPAALHAVRSTDRQVMLGVDDGNTVHTVEHVLAGLAALGVDDVTIELDGPEPPAGDGSSRAFVTALSQAGITEHGGESRRWRPRGPMTVTEGDSRYVVVPSATPRLTVTIDVPHPLVGRQSGCFDISGDAFAGALADARTFGWLRERDALQARQLARGATEENTVVLTDDGLASGALRWPDEFVRHKAVDLLGDLALLGGGLDADVVAFKPSHSGNVALARAISMAAQPVPGVLGIEKILAVIPHRYPMLLVDRITEMHGRDRIVGIKNVTINEPFFVGHFPDHPIMPGVLIVEAMAQVGGMLMMGTVDDPEAKVVYFMSLDHVKFRRPVVPGDQLRMELEMLQQRPRTCRMRGVAYVDGQAVAEAEMMAHIVDR